MDTKAIVVYVVNAGLVAGAGFLVFRGIITWQVASAFAVAMLVPSAAHVAIGKAGK